MFSCKYKFELKDCLTSAKYVYKASRRKKDKVVSAMIPVLFVLMGVLLVVDIVNHKSLVWDLILLIAVGFLQVLSLLMPYFVRRSQIKQFNAQKLGEMDAVEIKIENNTCTTSFIKGEKTESKTNHNLKNLSSYLEDNTYIILVFNNAEFITLKKQYLTGGVDNLKAHLNKLMNKGR